MMGTDRCFLPCLNSQKTTILTKNNNNKYFCWVVMTDLRRKTALLPLREEKIKRNILNTWVMSLY